MIDKSKEFNEKYMKAIAKAMNEIGLTGVAEIQSNAPVKSGDLRRSYTFKYKDLICTIGTNIDYAIAVEFKPVGSGGRPHFRSSLEAQKEEFRQILIKHLKEVKV